MSSNERTLVDKGVLGVLHQTSSSASRLLLLLLIAATRTHLTVPTSHVASLLLVAAALSLKGPEGLFAFLEEIRHVGSWRIEILD